MKRIAIIIGVLFLLIIGLLGTMYAIRKSEIKNQYISTSSTRILSIAIDDLLLDNLTNLLSWNKSQREKANGENLIKNIIFNAGINIPARIYLFNTTTHMNGLFGILPLKNYDDCFSFFANQFPDEIDLIDKEKGIVSVTLNRHIHILFNRSHIVYELTWENNPNFKDLQALLEEPEKWTKIGSATGFDGIIPQKHISYIQKDGHLQLEAKVSKHKTQVEGRWKLSQGLEDSLVVRAMDTTKQIVTLWNLLPLSEIPAVAQIMNKYTGIKFDQLHSSYFDLQVQDDYIVQKDSAITYSYDDDFNPIEEILVQEVSVPNVTYSWRYDKLLEASLPDTMFYQVHKKQIGQYLINTTFNSFPQQVSSQETKHPLFFYIDFGKWPETWNLGITKSLKEKNVKVKMVTTLQDQNELNIVGQINY